MCYCIEHVSFLQQNLNKEKQSKKEFLVEFEQLQKRWNSLHRRFTSARNERDQFEKKIEQLESYLRSSEEAVNSLRADLEEARTLMDVKEVALCDRENELSYLSKEMERTKNILAEEQGKYRQLLQRQQLMTEDLTAAEQELKHKRELWANFRNERSEQEDVLLDLQKCLGEMERSLKLTQAEVEQLQAKLSKTESDNRMFKCDNNALCGQLKSAQEEVQHLRRKLDQNKVKLYDAEESFQHLKNVNMDLVKHEQALQEELEASHVQLMQLREELSCNADTLTKMKEALQHSKEVRKQLANRIEGLDKENTILQKALESKMVSSQLLEEENKKLQSLHEDEQRIQLNKQILRQKFEAFEQDMKNFEMMRATLEAERCAFQEERKAHESRQAQLKEQVQLLHCDLHKAETSLMERTVRRQYIMLVCKNYSISVKFDLNQS
jgi:chromosome segregation ATPase